MKRDFKKNLSKSLSGLADPQREAILSILKCLQDGKQIGRLFLKRLFLPLLAGLSQSDIADAIGETRQQLRSLTTYGAPTNQDGSYSLKAFFQWFKGYKKQDVSRLTNSRSRKTDAEASLAELELAEQVGRLVDREVQDRAWGEHVTTCRNMIQGIPHRLALILPDKERVKFIKEAEIEIEGILKNLAGEDEKGIQS